MEEPEVDAFDYEYRVDTDVITSVEVSGGQSDPDNPVTVQFVIEGSTYTAVSYTHLDVYKRQMLERAPRGDVRRAADYFKLIRYSFSGGAKSFAGKSCDIRRFFHLVWECSRRLAEVVIENKDCVDLIRQYDREDAFFYWDPPYYDAEDCYAAVSYTHLDVYKRQEPDR